MTPTPAEVEARLERELLGGWQAGLESRGGGFCCMLLAVATRAAARTSGSCGHEQAAPGCGPPERAGLVRCCLAPGSEHGGQTELLIMNA
jgi:hypothetical protein